jgi:hypothetical protein
MHQFRFENVENRYWSFKFVNVSPTTLARNVFFVSFKNKGHSKRKMKKKT